MSADICEKVREMIQAGIPGATAEVRGDGVHFAIRVVSERFEGLNSL